MPRNRTRRSPLTRARPRRFRSDRRQRKEAANRRGRADLAAFDGALFFSADDGTHGAELHRFVANDNMGRGEASMGTQSPQQAAACRALSHAEVGAAVAAVAHEHLARVDDAPQALAGHLLEVRGLR